MKRIFLLTRRELAASFRTWSGYIIVALMLAVDALLFNAYALAGPSKLSSEVLADFFGVTSGITLLGSVFLSMRAIAEERQSGTLTLLLSSPIRDREIILGKFAAGWLVLGIFLVATLPMTALVALYGRVSVGHIAAGYLGLALVAAMGFALGVLGSALSANQVVAAVASGMMVLALTTCWLLGRVSAPPLTELTTALAWWGHFEPFCRGVVGFSNLTYFVFVAAVALFGATRVLEARRWH